jgi:endonuclease YncB( thermonuclease family)
MHIKFNRSLRGDYGRARVGDVKLVEKDVGKSLVERGLAVEVDAPKAGEVDKKNSAAKTGAQA